MSEALKKITATWQGLYDNAVKNGQDATMYKTVLDAHLAHPAAVSDPGAIKDAGADQDGDIADAPAAYSADPPPASSADAPPAYGADPASSPFDAPTPSGKPSGAGRSASMMQEYSEKLPEGMPAVFDLPVDASGKTPRAVIEEQAKKYCVPAILIAAQSWQETNAGLFGRDPAFNEEYGKPRSGGGGGGDTFLGAISTSTANPGNGKGDIGLMQINPDTLDKLTQGGPREKGVVFPANPHLEGMDRADIGDAVEIAATLNRVYFDHYKKQDYVSSDYDAWMYSMRAYNSGEGAVVEGDPRAVGKPGTDPTYIDKLEDHMEDFASGAAPRWAA